jgi:hypothetical protein
MQSRGEFDSGSKTGTTTGSYVAVLTIDTRGCGPQGKLLISLKNTHGSNTMYYKIDGYPGDPKVTTGLSIAVKAETQVNSTDVDKNYAAVVLSVKSNSGACTYQADWTTY